MHTLQINNSSTHSVFLYHTHELFKYLMHPLSWKYICYVYWRN